ncbi:MAG TPA: hypothetical protein VGB59_12905 [Allosphingosinicella sp.]|jgi:hypothetical protein
MLLLAALLLAAEPAAAEREVLDSFKAACARPGNIEEMKADAVAAGWEPIADEAEPRVARLNELGRKSVEKDAKTAGANYRRSFGERVVFLILSRYEDKTGVWGAGCRLYDFEATVPLDSAMLEGWMGKPPTGVQNPLPGLSKHLWEPGWRDGITLEVNHVPQGHEVGKMFGLSGNILVAQALGGF